MLIQLKQNLIDKFSGSSKAVLTEIYQVKKNITITVEHTEDDWWGEIWIDIGCAFAREDLINQLKFKTISLKIHTPYRIQLYTTKKSTLLKYLGGKLTDFQFCQKIEKVVG